MQFFIVLPRFGYGAVKAATVPLHGATVTTLYRYAGVDLDHLHGRVQTRFQSVADPVEDLNETDAECKKQRLRASGQVVTQGDRLLLNVVDADRLKRKNILTI